MHKLRKLQRLAHRRAALLRGGAKPTDASIAAPVARHAGRRSLRRGAPLLRGLTPERLLQNVHVATLLEGLLARGMLERFVVDEAHCVVSNNEQ